MKNFYKIMGIIAMVAVITIGFVSCGGEEEEVVVLKDFSGKITIQVTKTKYDTITFNDNIVGYCELKAFYDGEDVDADDLDYSWKVGDMSLTGVLPTLKPADAGNFKVTISKTGYNSKTSAAVEVKDVDYKGFFGKWKKDKTESGDTFDDFVTITDNKFVLTDNDTAPGKLDFTLTSVVKLTDAEFATYNVAANAVGKKLPTGYTDSTGFKFTGTTSADSTPAGYKNATSVILFLAKDGKSFIRTSLTDATSIQYGTSVSTKVRIYNVVP